MVRVCAWGEGLSGRTRWLRDRSWPKLSRDRRCRQCDWSFMAQALRAKLSFRPRQNGAIFGKLAQALMDASPGSQVGGSELTAFKIKKSKEANLKGLISMFEPLDVPFRLRFTVDDVIKDKNVAKVDR